MDRGILPSLLGYRLRRAQQLVFQHFAASVGDLGVTPGQVGLLVMIDANPGISQAALAKALGVERASLGETVKHLVARGHIVQHPSPMDRRSHALHLSEGGEALLERLVPRILAHESAASAHLSEEERATLLRLLGRLAGDD